MTAIRPRTRFRSPRSGGQDGFTLIEALVALAIVAMSVTAIGALIASNLRGTWALDQKLLRAETARSALMDIPARTRLAPGRSSGELAGHRWQMNVQPPAASLVAPSSADPWIPRIVTLQVQSPSGGTLQLETVRLQRRQGGER